MPTDARLTRAGIARVARAAGFPESQIAMAIAVALAESGGNPKARGGPNSNGSFDYGLFQINTVHKALLQSGDRYSAEDNAKMAYRVWKDAGGSWKPWATFNHGTYKKFYKETDEGNDEPPEKATRPELVKQPSLAEQVGLPTPSNPLGAFQILTVPDFWKRVGIGVLGTALIIAGIVIIFRRPIADGTKQIISLVGPGGKVAAAAKLADSATKGN